MKKQLHILSLNDAFESLDDLWLYNLNKYFETNDANWFIDGYTGKEKKIDPMQLEPIAINLTEKYYERTGDRSLENRIKIVAKIDQLRTKYVVCSALVGVMWKGFGDSEEELTYRAKYIQELGKWGFKMNYMGTHLDDAKCLVEISEALQGIETQIALQEQKLKNKRQADAVTMEQMLVIAEKGLGLQRKINPRDTTVSEWCGYLDQLAEIAKKN